MRDSHSPAALLATFIERFEFKAAAILFAGLGLFVAIGSIEVALGIVLPIAGGCVAADRWLAFDTARRRMEAAWRERQERQWGAADFERLVEQLRALCPPPEQEARSEPEASDRDEGKLAA